MNRSQGFGLVNFSRSFSHMMAPNNGTNYSHYFRVQTLVPIKVVCPTCPTPEETLKTFTVRSSFHSTGPEASTHCPTQDHSVGA